MPVDLENSYIRIGLFLLAISSLLISWAAGRRASPSLAILSRWLRWILIAYLAAGTVHIFRPQGYPFFILFAVCGLAWFILETGYNWLAIQALSRSEMPLFPRFNENTRGDEWPSDKGFIQIKDWLRKNNFKKVQALISDVNEHIIMRMSAYENADATVRLHILFLPHARGNTAVCFNFYSTSCSGLRLVTDNLFLPFGGFYPEAWEVERRPWMRSIERLFHRHLARIDAKAEALVPVEMTPLEQVNDDQRQLEMINRELGFLSTPEAEEEEGRLTPAGRARIWQEIWTLSYLGKPLRYL